MNFLSPYWSFLLSYFLSFPVACPYVDSVLELVELQGLRHSLVGVGVGGGEDAGLSLERVSGGACAAGGWQHRQAGMQLSLWAEPHLSKGFPIHVSLPRPPACPAPPWPHAPTPRSASACPSLWSWWPTLL